MLHDLHRMQVYAVFTDFKKGAVVQENARRGEDVQITAVVMENRGNWERSVHLVPVCLDVNAD